MKYVSYVSQIFKRNWATGTSKTELNTPSSQISPTLAQMMESKSSLSRTSKSTPPTPPTPSSPIPDDDSPAVIFHYEDKKTKAFISTDPEAEFSPALTIHYEDKKTKAFISTEPKARSGPFITREAFQKDLDHQIADEEVAKIMSGAQARKTSHSFKRDTGSPEYIGPNEFEDHQEIQTHLEQIRKDRIRRNLQNLESMRAPEANRTAMARKPVPTSFTQSVLKSLRSSFCCR